MYATWVKLANVVVKEEINEAFREEVARDFEDGISEKNMLSIRKQ